MQVYNTGLQEKLSFPTVLYSPKAAKFNLIFFLREGGWEMNENSFFQTCQYVYVFDYGFGLRKLIMLCNQFYALKFLNIKILKWAFYKNNNE